jgi:hypothetical protein
VFVQILLYVTAMSNSKMYCIPARFRKTENLHILFWLVKDLSWAMLWRPLGIFMIIPTLSVAILITWQTRKIKAELFHNLAVDFWICANALWMLLEFTGKDDRYRVYTSIPFGIGLFFILSYYLVVLPKEKRKEKTSIVNSELSIANS